MKILIFGSVLTDNNWIILIGLIAAVLGIIDFITNHKLIGFIRNTFIIKHKGIIPSKFLKYKNKLEGEVFAIELLSEEILLEKNSKGENSILINRDNVKQALINNSGKKIIINQLVQNSQPRL